MAEESVGSTPKSLSPGLISSAQKCLLTCPFPVSAFKKETNDFPSDYKDKIAALFKSDQTMKRSMARMFGMLEGMVAKVAVEGPSAMSLEIPYDEKALLESQEEYIKRTLTGTVKVHVFLATDDSALGPEAKRAVATPMHPSFHFVGDTGAPAKGGKK